MTPVPIYGFSELQPLKSALRFGALCLLLLLPFLALAQKGGDIFPPKPEPAVYVHDYSGWLLPEQKQALEQKLRGYWDSTSTQVVVMIRPDNGDYDKSSYAFELGNRWGIGRKDKNNGVVMLIKSEAPDRGIFIATGYGTEGALPDITCGQIIRNTMGPYFRQQRYYEGINAGVDEIIKNLQGEFTKEAPSQPLTTGETIAMLLFMLLIFGFLGYMVYRIVRSVLSAGKMISGNGTNRRNRKDDDNNGGWFGGWGGGGGGSWGSGGGGGSSWGGGGGSFGGGSFGGGGAGGDW